jgi:asparagine synthetase B (glutamine-hydrolysing)
MSVVAISRSNSTDVEPRIALSQWYACLTLDPGGGRTPKQRPGESVRIGPFTVFKPNHGCELKTFGTLQAASAVIFDGFLFDRDQLASELALDRTVAADADIVAAAFERWGTDVFDRLDGCYLAAIWDGSRRRLLLGHDALGRHPAFYAIESGTVWFASNILALSSSGHVPPTPNRLSLALAQLLYWPETGQTFFERVRRVRPGHFLQITSGHLVSERKYWDHLPSDNEPWLEDASVYEQFEEQLTRAVARCLALSPRGIMLSGGVDSVTIAALASQHLRAGNAPPLVAVSAQTGGLFSNEERVQAKVCQALDMPHEVSVISDWTGGRDDVSLSLELMSELPSPTGVWRVGAYTKFYQRAAAQQLNVLLTGAGGDNWLGVADAHAADLLRHWQFLQLYRFMKADVGTAGASLRRSAQRLLWHSGARMLVDSYWAMLAPKARMRHHRHRWSENLPRWLAPEREFRQQLIDHLLNRRTAPLTAAGTVPTSYYRHSLRPSASPHWHHENENAHHIETLCGLRLLSPYHDRRVVSFFNRISPRVLLHGDRYKGLLRSLVGKHLPGLGLESQRRDYLKEAQDRDLLSLRRSIVHAWPGYDFDALDRLGVVSAAGARREIAGADRKGFEQLARLFSMMSAEHWIRLHTTS